MTTKVVLILLCALIWGLPAYLAIPVPLPVGQNMMKKMYPVNHSYTDAMAPPKPEGNFTLPGNGEEFKYKWLKYGEECSDEESIPEMVQIAGTHLLSDYDLEVACKIVGRMTRNMPKEYFDQFALEGSVGIFTFTDKVTIFPEYAKGRDRPECEGTCEGNCSQTCTGGGAKWDDFPGLGARRAAILADNVMCTDDDPFGKKLNGLVHEVAHTVHGYALPATTKLSEKISAAYGNAYKKQIFDINSGIMSSAYEYFAGGTTVYFNVDHYFQTGMASCCLPSGQFCETEADARQWLAIKDPLLYECLKLIWSNNDDSLPGEMTICP